MSILFERDRLVSSKQIKNIFLEGSLLEYIACAFFDILQMIGKYIMINIIF